MGPGLELQGFKHGGPGGDPYVTGHGAVSTVAYHNGAVTKTAKYQYNTAGQLTKLLDWRRQACFPALGDKRPTSRSFLLRLGGCACNPKSLRSSHAKMRRDSVRKVLAIITRLSYAGACERKAYTGSEKVGAALAMTKNSVDRAFVFEAGAGRSR